MSRLLPRSLRLRLILSFGFLIFVTLFLAGTATVYLLREQQEEAATERVGLLADPMARRAGELEYIGGTPKQIIDILRSEYAYEGVRILLVDNDDVVVGDSANDALKGQTLSQISRSNGNAEVNEDLQYRVSKLSRGPDDLLLFTTTRYGRPGVDLIPFQPTLQTIVAVDQSDIRGAWRDLMPRLFLAGGIALFFGVIAAGLVARSITRPLARITAASEEMAQGNYEQQIPAYGGDEVSRLASAFNAMSRQVSRSHRTLRDFLANVSHELKTPLTSVQGFSQAMVDGSLSRPEDYAEAGRIINDEAVRMRGLVDDLLYLSQVEQGEFSVQLDEMSPAELLQATRERFERRAEQAGINLAIETGDMPLIKADGRRMEQALANIVDNAVRHTPAGGSVTMTAAANDGHIQLSVHNTGSVIPPESLPHVFDRFFQADPAGARADANTGLGLAITKEIVQAHGGSVEAKSSVEDGTRFTITLPAPANGNPSRSQSVWSAPGSSLL
jgi:signal transduction histidine kinase